MWPQHLGLVSPGSLACGCRGCLGGREEPGAGSRAWRSGPVACDPHAPLSFCSRTRAVRPPACLPDADPARGARGSPATLLSSSRTLPGFRGNETTAGLEKEPRQAGPVVPRTLGSSAPFSEPGSGARVALPFSLRPGPGPTQAPLNASTNTGQCVCPAQFACDTLAPSLSAALQGGGPTLGQRRGSSTSERTEEELSGPDAGTRGCLPR